jgi:hypothetical protein
MWLHLMLCSNNQTLCHEDVQGNGGITPQLLTSALVGGEWSASRLGCFIPGKTAAGAQRIGWVNPRDSLDTLERIKVPCHLPGIECWPSTPQRVTTSTELSGLTMNLNSV